MEYEAELKRHLKIEKDINYEEIKENQEFELWNEGKNLKLE